MKFLEEVSGALASDADAREADARNAEAELVKAKSDADRRARARSTWPCLCAASHLTFDVDRVAARVRRSRRLRPSRLTVRPRRRRLEAGTTWPPRARGARGLNL